MRDLVVVLRNNLQIIDSGDLPVVTGFAPFDQELLLGARFGLPAPIRPLPISTSSLPSYIHGLNQCSHRTIC